MLLISRSSLFPIFLQMFNTHSRRHHLNISLVIAKQNANSLQENENLQSKYIYYSTSFSLRIEFQPK